jgi:hypothetical protein
MAKRLLAKDLYECLVSRSPSAARQIGKDAELLGTGQVSGYTWHFFESPVTGLSGPSVPLTQALEQAGIDIVEHAGTTPNVKWTLPVADLRVSGLDGTVRGLIEVKVGNSPYTSAQQLKDFFIQSIYGTPTNVVRYPTFP